MNPVLPENCFVPDGEAHVMPDGRLYVYGSWDIYGDPYYCSKELHCFSTDDMEHWVDHGLIFRNDSEWNGVPWCPDTLLFAPDAIYHDGKYYLYVCGPDDKLGFEGVASAPSPVGPFSPAEKIELASGDGIDPAIFVDDDGQAYYFWGQFSLRGGKLAPDMKTLIPESVNTAILTEWEHGFHEGSSLRKRNGKYYLVYSDISRGKASCLGYAMADHPLGPYHKCGIIIDNIYCDPKTWNNHGSIACFRDQWYVFYHRASQNSFTSRRMCVEPIEFDENGFIREVVPTSQGASEPLDATSPIRASWACRMMGQCHITPHLGREILTACTEGPWGLPGWAEYKYVDFGNGVNTVTLRLSGKGEITLKTEGNAILASAEIHCEEFCDITIPTNSITGVHALWLFYAGDEIAVDSFTFSCR